MRRLGMFLAVGVLVIGLALPALAQQENFTVSWRGEMRVQGFAFDNIRDFNDDTDDDGTFYYQRWRFYTTVESADKKARAVWALEIGDLTWGTGGGPSPEYGGQSGSRVGPSQGAETGADGVNVETKNLYVQFDIPGVPNSNLLLGAHNIVYLSGPNGAFMDDDAFGIQFNWKADPVDLQLYTAKLNEGDINDGDDNDMYVARLGINVTKDTRVTVEGMIIDQGCIAKETTDIVTVTPGVDPATGEPVLVVGTGTAVGDCIEADFGDTFWIGGTVATKMGDVKLDGAVVYGQRQTAGTGGRTFEDSGFGAWLTAQVPLGPAQTWWHGWYATGDDNRPLPTSSRGTKTRDGDNLPVPIEGSSFFSVPFVAEWIFGTRTIGLPSGPGQPLYGAQNGGTWGIGGSAIFKLTSALSAGGGVGFVGASDTPAGGLFGDNLVELDAGALYSYNANLSFQLIGAYQIPDQGDDAWAVGWRTRFAF